MINGKDQEIITINKTPTRPRIPSSAYTLATSNHSKSLPPPI